MRSWCGYLVSLRVTWRESIHDTQSLQLWGLNIAKLEREIFSVEKLFPLHWVQPVEWVLRNSLLDQSAFCFSPFSSYYHNCFWAAKSWQINCEQINTALFVFMIGLWLCITLSSFHWLPCVCLRRLLSIWSIFLQPGHLCRPDENKNMLCILSTRPTMALKGKCSAWPWHNPWSQLWRWSKALRNDCRAEASPRLPAIWEWKRGWRATCIDMLLL